MSVLHFSDDLQSAIKSFMRAKNGPVTCTDLMGDEKIREHALKKFGGPHRDTRLTTNKMSDLLGHLWRRGLLTRYPAPQHSNSFARFAYQWVESADAAKSTEPVIRRKGKPTIKLSEEGGGEVQIETEQFIITIRPKEEK